MTQKVTLSTIAKASGLSIASVSRVIRSPHLTTPTTQARVYEAMKSLNYNVKQHLKAHETIGNYAKVLVIDNQHKGSSEINRGIEVAVKQAGYKLFWLRFSFFDANEVQQIINYTVHHGISGILIINDSPYIDSLMECAHAFPPIVLVNQFKLNQTSIHFDHLSMAYNATRHLLEQGHQRIGLMLSQEQSVINQQIVLGYQKAYRRFCPTYEPTMIFYQCQHYSQLKSQWAAQMRTGEMPTALLCGDTLDLCQSSVTESVKEEDFADADIIDNVLMLCDFYQMSIPSKLSLIFLSHKKYHLHGPTFHRITSMYKPLFRMGEKAVEMLLDRIKHPQEPKRVELLQGEWSPRHSVRSLPQSSPAHRSSASVTEDRFSSDAISAKAG